MHTEKEDPSLESNVNDSSSSDREDKYDKDDIGHQKIENEEGGWQDDDNEDSEDFPAVERDEEKWSSEDDENHEKNDENNKDNADYQQNDTEEQIDGNETIVSFQDTSNNSDEPIVSLVMSLTLSSIDNSAVFQFRVELTEP